MKHPATYSDALFPLLSARLMGRKRILDPFGGTSKLKSVLTGGRVYTSELEWEWAKMGADVQGNALRLPFRDGSFDAICTSPCYGNRMADHHDAKDTSRRITYRHTLGRPLHSENAGMLQWGRAYRDFHVAAWEECRRVLARGGLFVLNVSDHIRGGEVMPVSKWHAGCLEAIGLTLQGVEEVPTPRMRFGKNSKMRVSTESVFVFLNGAKP